MNQGITRKELEKVYYLKKELQMWEKRYNELIADISTNTPSADGMPHSVTNNISSPTEDKAVRIADHIDSIHSKQVELERVVCTIEKYITTITDPIIAQILEYRCVQCLKWNDIAGKIGTPYTDSYLRKIYSEYLRKNFK